MKIGYWMTDDFGLPCFRYVGVLPYKAQQKDGTPAKLPEDPWFLLGNYHLTLFTHVSGEYELITGQRAWGRMNQGSRRNSGQNHSVLTTADRVYQLAGMDSYAADPIVCKRVFGCGFADYTYEMDGLYIEKRLSVKPSDAPLNGTSGFLLEVIIRNNTSKSLDCKYTESVGVNYKEIQFQSDSPSNRGIVYKNESMTSGKAGGLNS